MFFFSKRQNRLFDYVLGRKDRCLDYKNVFFHMVEKFAFLQWVNLWFWSKISIFDKLCFSFQNEKIDCLIMY